MRIHKFPKKRYKARKKKKTHTCPVIVSSDTHPANDAAYATGEERERETERLHSQPGSHLLITIMTS